MNKCPNCGAPMQTNECSYCHYVEPVQSENVVNNVVVNNVYATQVQNGRNYVTMVSPKNKMVTLLLCIFLGCFGIHYFYVGRVGKGILYLFTGGLFGIGWVIDIVVILCGGFKDSNRLPIKQ